MPISKIKKFAKISLLLVTSAYLPVHSASKTQAQEQPRQLQRKTASLTVWPNKAKRWALVIGVDKYRDAQIGALKGSENDARTLADALVRYAGFPKDQVILLSTDQPEERQPTRVNILRRLSNLTAVVPKDGLLLVSFAGHGMERKGSAYLLPTDAQISEDISFLEDTALSVERIKGGIRNTGVSQVVILLDACRNDPGGRADAPNLMSRSYVSAFSFDVRNREVQAFATIYATAVGERAYEYSERRQGYFTWAIIEALKGGAANESGEITLASLVEYVQNTVPKRIGIDLGANKKQRPFAIVEGYKADQLVIAVVDKNSLAAETTVVAPPADSNTMEVSFWETIKNSNDPSDFQAYLDRFPNGTFAALARRRATSTNRPAPTNAAPASEPTTASMEDPEEALEQAERDLRDKDYRKATSVAERVLANNPANAKANLIMGLASLQMKKYTNSANYLSKVIEYGGTADIPIQHHHYAFMVGDQLCSGAIRIGKGLIEFRSASVPNDDFSAPVSKIYELVTDPAGGGRIRMKVGINKGAKEDKRNVAFHPLNAFVGRKQGSSVNSIFCEDCLSDAQAISALIQQLIKTTAAQQEISATGNVIGQTNAGTRTEPTRSPENAAILAELIDFEKRAFDLIQKGDRASLAAMMVDDFVQVQDGKTYNKSQLLAAVKPQRNTLNYSYESLEVKVDGEAAVLSGVVILRATGGNAMVTIRQNFKDSFVRREGKWLVTRSEITTQK